MKKDQITELGTLTATIMDEKFMAKRDPDDLTKVSWMEAVHFKLEDAANDTTI